MNDVHKQITLSEIKFLHFISRHLLTSLFFNYIFKYIKSSKQYNLIKKGNCKPCINKLNARSEETVVKSSKF